MDQVKTPESWMATYYPVPADSPEALADPVAHSLRKWEGLRPNVLVAHGLKLRLGNDVVDNTSSALVLDVTANTCALCMQDIELSDGECTECPLAKSRNGVPCATPADNEFHSPWKAWRYENDPEPMIRALEKAAQYEARHGK